MIARNGHSGSTMDDAAVRALLTDQRDRLVAAINATACQFARTRALQLLARVRRALDRPHDLSCMAGEYGANGWGPAVSDAVADCERAAHPALVDARDALKRRAA